MNLETTKKAYNEILKAANKHKDTCVFDVEEMERKSKLHLFGLELKEKYGLDIDPISIYRFDWVDFDEHRFIGWFGDKYNRNISWSVDGRQPQDELLVLLKFPTGAYIFGGDYPTQFFQQFWLELKVFNPDYIDEVNHSLYWKIENAKEIFNSFEAILKKHHQLNSEDIKKRKIEQMKAELSKLESQV